MEQQMALIKIINHNNGDTTRNYYCKLKDIIEYCELHNIVYKILVEYNGEVANPININNKDYLELSILPTSGSESLFFKNMNNLICDHYLYISTDLSDSAEGLDIQGVVVHFTLKYGV